MSLREAMHFEAAQHATTAFMPAARGSRPYALPSCSSCPSMSDFTVRGMDMDEHDVQDADSCLCGSQSISKLLNTRPQSSCQLPAVHVLMYCHPVHPVHQCPTSR